MLLACLGSCTKPGFLDKTPDTRLVLPNTLSTLQALLDNEHIINQTPKLGELSADDFWLDYGFWQGLKAEERNAYVWAQDIYEGGMGIGDWDIPYQQVFYANTVLEGLKGIAIGADSLQKAASIAGSAYFIRAYAFYELAQLFCMDYNPGTAAADPGIPLRLNPDIGPVSVRASVEQTYKQILQDLEEARALLDAERPGQNLNRPSLPALMAFRARVCLTMGDFTDARNYADSCLKLYPVLVDYNSIDTTQFFPFPLLNPEILYQGNLQPDLHALLGLASPLCIIDSGLYRSYVADDLRRPLFFGHNSNGQPTIKAGYNSSIFPFSGLATDEVWLIRAESSARLGDVGDALNSLNELLVNRWRTGSFVPLQAADADTALALVLAERRKELPFRGLRWTDLRRLNRLAGSAGIMLKRELNGVEDSLPSGDKRYIMPIPPDVIATSGMQQNPR